MTPTLRARLVILAAALFCSAAVTGCVVDTDSPDGESEISIQDTEQAVSGGLFTTQGFAAAACPAFATVGSNAFLSGTVSYNADNRTDFDFYINVWQGIYDNKGHYFRDSSTWNLVRANTSVWWPQTQKFPYLNVAYYEPGDVTLTALTYITDSSTGQVVYANASHTCTFHVY